MRTRDNTRRVAAKASEAKIKEGTACRTGHRQNKQNNGYGRIGGREKREL